MAKRARRRKHTKPITRSTTGDRIELVEIGLADHASDDDLDQHWHEQCLAASAQFRDLLDNLLERVRAVDPAILLAQSSYHSANADGQIPEWSEPNAVLQHHVELIHSLLLWYRLNEFDAEQYRPWEFREIHGIVVKASTALQRKRIYCTDTPASPQSRAEHGIIQQVRSETQIVRNWAYQHQIARVVTDLFAPLDDRIQELLGATIGNLVAMGQNVIAEVERRTQIHQQYLRDIYKADSYQRAVAAFCAAVPAYASEAGSIEATLRAHWGSLDEAKIDLMAQSDVLLPSLFELHLGDFVAAYPGSVDPESLRNVLDWWSLEFGGLADHDVDRLFVDNPIWTRPIIRLGPDHYTWPTLGLFYSHCLEMMLHLIRDQSALMRRYHDRRGKYLEAEAERLFRQSFPTAEIFGGSQWDDVASGKQYENDLLVIVNSVAFIIEAKSHIVTAPARRGGRESLKTKVEDMLVAPSEQALRFVAYLQEGPGRYGFETRSGVINDVDVTRVTRYVPFALTLDDLFGVRASTAKLREAGFVSESAELIPSISLTDLETVFDLLADAGQILHYLIRRTELANALQIVGFENDLLGLYVKTGFVLSNIEDTFTMLDLSRMSAPIDHYYLRVARKHRPRKPQRRITPWWRDILDRLVDGVHGWPEVAYILLNADFEQQRIFEERFKYVQRNVRRYPRSPKTVDSVQLACGHGGAICGVAYGQLSPKMRDELFQTKIMQVVEAATEELRFIVVIGVDVARSDYPYSTLAIFSPVSQELDVVG